MIQFLKKKNRTLLELWTGMIVLTLICIIPGVIWAGNVLIYIASLVIGTAMAILSSIHMYKSLDTALDFEEGVAKKKIYFAYYIRYAVIVLIFAIICLTKIFNPLIVFLGYMTLKIGALIQPVTHKVYNKIFNEVDAPATALDEIVNEEDNNPSN